MKNTSPPLSIALVYDDSLDGSEGVTQYVKTVGKWLSERGHKVSYMCGQTKSSHYAGAKIYSLSKNVHVRFNNNRLSIPLWARSNTIKSALNEIKPDILHVQMPHSPLLAQRLVNISPAAAVGTFHIYPSSWRVGLASRFLKLLYFGGLKRISEVVSVSSAAQAFAASAFGLNTPVLPNVVELERFRSADKNRPYHIVFLGRLVPRKGCGQLIRAFAEVSQQLPKATMSIAGDGPQKPALQRLARDLALESKVRFLGFIDEQDKPGLLASASIACFPSLGGESFGIVLIEAMAAGAGVVLAGDNAGYRSVLGSHDELLIDPKKTETIAVSIISFFEDESKFSVAHQWQQHHVKQYDIAEVGPKIERLYRRAIAKRNL